LPGWILSRRAFFLYIKNFLKLFYLNVAKNAISLRVSIEGEFYPIGREARRPFSVSTNKPEKERGYDEILRPVCGAAFGF